MKSLGRRIPSDWAHVDKYPLQLASVTTVNKVLSLPAFHSTWDQGREGACVGFGTSMMLSIINEAEARRNLTLPYTHKYDPRWLWNRAKEIDEWPDTNPGDENGTSVRAACDVLRTQGHVRILSGKTQPVNLKEGIASNRWATTVDAMRSSIAAGIPISIGVNWYTSFDSPEYSGGFYWIGRNNNLGTVRGGHCVCVYGASDNRQAFRVKNSWGSSYPLVWLTYSAMSRLLSEYGEATLVTDTLE